MFRIDDLGDLGSTIAMAAGLSCASGFRLYALTRDGIVLSVVDLAPAENRAWRENGAALTMTMRSQPVAAI